MNRSILAAIRCSLMFLIPSVTYAISAQWDLDPVSGDWNTAANWTPNGVPNGSADTATFGLSDTTDVSISATTEINGITFTTAATNSYTITASPGFTLTISGAGIINNSGVAQGLAAADGGRILFTNSATAGNAFISTEGEFSSVQFSNSASAGNATIFNHVSSVQFSNRSSAGSATITCVDSNTQFFNSSTAGNSIIELDFSDVVFHDHSTAGSAGFLVHDSAVLRFLDNSSAGSAFLGSVGQIYFSDSSTAGSAFVSGGHIEFSGSSRGGTAQVGVGPNPFTDFLSTLDISGHNAPGVTIGSLSGGGVDVFVELGANNLTVGSNNLSTTFAGVIRGTGGSLTKIGTGTLDLTENNTYTGNTNINRGVLQVDGSITGNTFVNHKGTLAGTGIINGNVMNNEFGTVRPGGAVGAPGMLTIVHNYTQTQYATLMIQIAGTNTGDFSLLNVLGNANLNGFLDPVLLNGFVPTIGDSFVFLKYAGLTGGIFQIPNPVFNHGTEQWLVNYFQNRAILTVAPHTPGVPDQGSTFLLLALGLLGLVTFRRQLLRGQL